MNLKTKITLGFLAVLLLLAGIGSYTLYSLRRLDRTATNVLKENFYSVQLGQQLYAALDELTLAHQQRYLGGTAPAGYEATVRQGLRRFQQSLTREAGNITEPGEREVVDSLTHAFDAYQLLLDPQSTEPRTAAFYLARILPQHQLLRTQTGRMVQLNMQALTRKNEQANRAATQVTRYTLAMLVFSGLIMLFFVLSVPESAVMPLRKLQASIDHAANHNFTSSIPVESHDEFGAVARAFNRMLVQLQDYRTSTLAQLMAERNRVTSLVNNLDEGLLLIDENRRIIVANPIISSLLDVPAAKLVGRPADELARENDLFREMLRYLDVPAAQRDKDTPLLTIAQSGEEAYFRLTVNDVISFNEAIDKMEFVGSVLTLRNVSEYKKLDQAKSNFLATVSHELKTPLSSINFSLKLLQNGKVGPLNAEQQNIVLTLKQENQRLLKMVGELIDVSRLESGNIQLNFQPSGILDIVQFAADTIQLQLQPKQLTLDVQVPATLPPVRADIEKTTWVLLNLLANAIRYSPEQEQIHIRASLSADRQQVQVSIQDHGPGIAPQYQEKIFQRFVQIPDKNGYKGGSGLGLSIAREFIGSQGGLLWVESELGAGSTFMFTLPLAAPESA
ncbi:Signal transduction histidine kinase [Hymenobacter daecheongensis DSM 21074]|uniref:histidine kinase n=1 Tax=Hymenobacter daecheongensis DSM 21074 TaxID=1121955 RepID=A0A1M6D8L4_9BACT|nr:HAMP domain-containing histidine kinase [Hymenobacter daecheongensis]SHI69509.1 Signal transduction histidine kinase [Hymenobacter daecheongensis DSM 21074]